MYSKRYILSLVEEEAIEWKKTKKVPVYVDAIGNPIHGSKWVCTERYKQIVDILNSKEARVFKCIECENYFGYYELNIRWSDFDKNWYVCSHCC